jgi:hypothetical protein
VYAVVNFLHFGKLKMRFLHIALIGWHWTYSVPVLNMGFKQDLRQLKKQVY